MINISYRSLCGHGQFSRQSCLTDDCIIVFSYVLFDFAYIVFPEEPSEGTVTSMALITPTKGAGSVGGRRVPLNYEKMTS